MQVRVKLILLFVVLMVGTFLIIGCDVNDPLRIDDDVNNTRYRASDPFSYIINSGEQNKVKINAIHGPVEIVGVAGLDHVEISGERIVYSESSRDAQAHLDDLQVSFSDYGTALVVITDQPDETYGRDYQVEYYLRIPDNWNVEVDLVEGTVNVDSINANVTIELTDGLAEIDAIYGNVDIELVNGNIAAKMELPRNGTCDFSSVNGLIELFVPETTSARFQANVTNGQISLNGLTLSNPSSTTRSMSGTLGDGAGQIKLKTVNGSIRTFGYE